MFFILSKLLLFFLSPFTWLAILIIAYFITKNEGRKRKLKWSFIAVFFIFSNSFIFLECMRVWEIHGTKAKDLKPHDVAIVLGGMAEYDNDLDRLSMRRGGDRIWQAITLYKQGKVKKLLISGASGYVFERGLKEAAQMKADLVQWGIPEADILTEEKSINTYENALYSKEILNQHPELKSFVLVTSGSHMRRSLGCFEKQGLHCTPYSTDLYTGKKRFYFWDQYLIPNMETMVEWKKLMKEWVGYIAYDLKGYI